MRIEERQANLPEFIGSRNLDGLRLVPGGAVKVQSETREHLAELARNLCVSPEEAARYAIECGIASLHQAGAL